MSELKKRWGTRYRADGYGDLAHPSHRCWRRFLESTGDYNVACIESPIDSEGPYTLEIWDFTTDYWVHHATFRTLKEAKAVGRLLAGVALAKNF